jgi:RNA polymerase sigma-70 factor (ECF subfamily)
MAHLATFERERLRLLSLASRLLGSQSDAEDVVQETWIKFDGTDATWIENVPAWLTTVATRLCLDLLRRRDVRPEALPPREDGHDCTDETALLADELTAAFTVVIDELTPPQRVALVLHDAFGIPFEDVAHVIGTTVGSAKKLASRARGRVRRRVADPARETAKARELVEAFLVATREGDTDRLLALLDPRVVRTADPQVLPPGSAQRIEGAETVAAETRLFQANARRARVGVIDRRPGILVYAGSAVWAALVMRFNGDRITHYDVVADPRRLALLEIRV